jgi:hypothetical protein
MHPNTLIEDLMAGYANKQADLLLNKNLEERYLVLSQCVKQINALLDSGRLLEDEMAAFMQIGYQYYRLKEQFLEYMILKERDRY